jgi:hypothetical protein
MAVSWVFASPTWRNRHWGKMVQCRPSAALLTNQKPAEMFHCSNWGITARIRLSFGPVALHRSPGF